MTENPSPHTHSNPEQDDTIIPALYEFPFFAVSPTRVWGDCVSFYGALGMNMGASPKTAGQLRRVKAVVFDECDGLTADIPLLKAGNWTPSELRVACHMALSWQSPLCAGLLSVMDNVGWDIEPWQAQTVINANNADEHIPPQGHHLQGEGVSCTRPDGVYMLGNRDFVVRDGKTDDMPTLWLFIPSGKRIAFRFEYKVETTAQHAVERLQNDIMGTGFMSGGERHVMLMSGQSPEMVQNIARMVGIEQAHGLQSQDHKQALIANLVKQKKNPLILNRVKNGGWHGVICDKRTPPTLAFKTQNHDLSAVLDILDTAHLYRAFQYRVWTLGVCVLTVLVMVMFLGFFV